MDIKKRRIELNLTMKEVADFVGVSEATISRWESGNIANMKRSRIKALSDILGVSPLEIIGEKPDFSNLTATEGIIIELYRGMNAEGQAKLLEYARLLDNSGQYKKHNTDRMVEEA